ncbi:MAG: WG repeat-containing protein [Bacteroidota bacterium]
MKNLGNIVFKVNNVTIDNTLILALILFLTTCNIKEEKSLSNEAQTLSDTSEYSFKQMRTDVKKKIKDSVQQTIEKTVDYDYIGNKKESMILVEKDGLYGFIDERGEEIISLKFEDAQSFNEGKAAVKQKDLWGFIDKTGKFIISPTYEIATSFSEDLAAVRNKFLWGYIDADNHLMIPCSFDFAYPFENGEALVLSGSTWTNIDRTGNIVERQIDKQK